MKNTQKGKTEEERKKIKGEFFMMKKKKKIGENGDWWMKGPTKILKRIQVM